MRHEVTLIATVHVHAHTFMYLFGGKSKSPLAVGYFRLGICHSSTYHIYMNQMKPIN